MKYAAPRRRKLFFNAHQIKYLNNIHRRGNLRAEIALQFFKLLYFKFLFHSGDSIPSPPAEGRSYGVCFICGFGIILKRVLRYNYGPKQAGARGADLGRSRNRFLFYFLQLPGQRNPLNLTLKSTQRKRKKSKKPQTVEAASM